MEPDAGAAGDRPVVTLAGARVALGPLARVLLPRYQAWTNDVATQAWAGYPVRPESWTAERTGQWYERAATDAQNLWFTAYETAVWRAVGFAVLRDVDPRHRTAEFGLTIGDPAVRGQGYVGEAVALLLDLAFTGLGLNNVQLRSSPSTAPGRAPTRRPGSARLAAAGAPTL